MPVYKQKNGKWYVMVRYTDWQGNRKQKCQRGFKSKKEAQEWESQFSMQKRADINMTLESFVEVYEEDIRSRLKPTTWESKQNIIHTKILPYLGKRKLSEITPKDVIAWQNTIMQVIGKRGKPLAPTTQKSIHAQLSAIFNHGMQFYGLPQNPARLAGGIGEEESREMLFWTKEEYLKFADVMMDRPEFYYAFEVLYWCGVREGELLALTPSDFDFERKTLRINKNYQKIDGQELIQTTKTRYGTRMIRIPTFLCDEIGDYLEMQYNLGPDDRMFLLSKSRLFTAMKNGSRIAGIKKIRVHDLRHSHVSLLINNGFSAFEIGKRVGHSAEKITLRYAHLFPNTQDAMADFLDGEFASKAEGAEKIDKALTR